MIQTLFNIYVLSCRFGRVCASLYWNTEEYSVIKHLLWCPFASSTGTKNSLQSDGEGTRVLKTPTVSWCHGCTKTNYSKELTSFKHWNSFLQIQQCNTWCTSHDVDFKFSPPTKEVTEIDSLLTSLASGIFKVSGMIKWSGPQTTTEKNGAVVRNALLCDSTGTIELSVWQDHIKELDENKFIP